MIRSVTLLVVSLTLTIASFAQVKPVAKTPAKDEKSDVILKINGDELTGKVSEIGDTGIKFTYQGENLVYTIPKTDILKITFASGRIEFFNKPLLSADKKQETDDTPAAQPVNAGLEDHHNKVAILSFQFLKDNKDAGEEMGYKVQDDVYAFLNRHSSGLTIIDNRTTNALLIKNGITKESIRGLTMDEVCRVLGVEYVVTGGITQTKGAETSSSYGNANAKANDNKAKISSSSYSTSYQYTGTRVNIDIFNDKNDNLYSESRRGLLNTTDGSYSSPLEYLLKRCPLYRK